MVKLSVVIPAYNRKHHLKNTLLALDNQGGLGKREYEVVLVDDGSTDNTREYIEGVNKNFELKYIYLEKDGFFGSSRSRARNTGLKNASGDIVVFLDCDIIVKDDYLKETLKCFEMDNNIVLLTTRLMLPEGITIEEKEITSGSIFEKYRYDITKRELFEIRHIIFNQVSYNMSMDSNAWLFCYSCSLAFTRESLLAIGGSDENFTGWGLEDVDLGYRAFKQNLKIIYNYKLENLHQYHIESSRSDYKKNLQFLLNKHPELESVLPEKVFDNLTNNSELTKQENINDAMEISKNFQEEKSIRESEMKIFPIKSFDDVKNIKILVENALNRSLNFVLLDFVEDTDLYIWVQIFTYKKKCKVIYFPMSRKFD